jgi:hypothetical protein
MSGLSSWIRRVFRVLISCGHFARNTRVDAFFVLSSERATFVLLKTNSRRRHISAFHRVKRQMDSLAEGEPL